MFVRFLTGLSWILAPLFLALSVAITAESIFSTQTHAQRDASVAAMFRYLKYSVLPAAWLIGRYLV